MRKKCGGGYTDKIAVKSMVTLNGYVPPKGAKHPLTAEEEVEMTSNFVKIIQESIRAGKDVVACGDWNHLAEVWRAICIENGLRIIARNWVDTIAARVEGARIEGGCIDLRDRWQTKHNLLWMTVERSQEYDMFEEEVVPSARLIRKNSLEFEATVKQRLEEKGWYEMPLTEKIKNTMFEETYAEVGIEVTKRHMRDREEVGYPNRIAKIRDEATRLRKEGKAQEADDKSKVFIREKDRWWKALRRILRGT